MTDGLTGQEAAELARLQRAAFSGTTSDLSADDRERLAELSSRRRQRPAFQPAPDAPAVPPRETSDEARTAQAALLPASDASDVHRVPRAPRRPRAWLRCYLVGAAIAVSAVAVAVAGVALAQPRATTTLSGPDDASDTGIAELGMVAGARANLVLSDFGGYEGIRVALVVFDGPGDDGGVRVTCLAAGADGAAPAVSCRDAEHAGAPLMLDVASAGLLGPDVGPGFGEAWEGADRLLDGDAVRFVLRDSQTVEVWRTSAPE